MESYRDIDMSDEKWNFKRVRPKMEILVISRNYCFHPL